MRSTVYKTLLCHLLTGERRLWGPLAGVADWLPPFMGSTSKKTALCGTCIVSLEPSFHVLTSD